MIPQIITSPNNATIKQWALLKQAKHRKEQQQGLIEGVNALLEALKANIPIEAILYNTERFEGLDVVLDHLPDTQNPQLIETNEAVLARLADTASAPPIVAVFNFPRTETAIPTDDTVKPDALTPLNSQARLLVLDGLQDPGNVGTLIRSAVAFGCQAVVLLAPAVDVYSPKVIRASTGLVFQLPIIVPAPDWCTATFLTHLQAVLGWQVLLTSGHRNANNVAYHSVKSITTPLALVLGAEGTGIQLSEQVATEYQQIHIPMYETVESLNVALSGGILLSHFYALVTER
jgi:TrmH family RNA methyltransferase